MRLHCRGGACADILDDVATRFATSRPDHISRASFHYHRQVAFGTRRNVMEAIEARGGTPSDSAPTRESNYLVIGVFASRDWANTNYGRKIERAVELRDSRSGIAIISEEHWNRFVV